MRMVIMRVTLSIIFSNSFFLAFLFGHHGKRAFNNRNNLQSEKHNLWDFYA